MSSPLARSFSPDWTRAWPPLAAGIALASLAQAGNVLRVGPGRTYGDVQSAVDAAVHGDLVLVDPGLYPPFVVDGKELSIAAASVSFSLVPTAAQPEITVRNVPAGRTVTIHGAYIDFDDKLAPAVLVTANAGAVRLSEIEVDETVSLIDANVAAAVIVENTATFWLIDSSIWSNFQRPGNTLTPLCVGPRCNDGISGLELRNSSGAIQSSRIRGYFNDYTALGSGGDGLRTIGDCNLRLYQTDIPPLRGCGFTGGGGIFGGNAVHQVRTPSVASLIRSCGAGDQTPVYGPGSGLPALGGEMGGFYGFNNDNGVYTYGSLVLFRIVDHCDYPERNEVKIDQRVVPLGGLMTVYLRSARDRRFALLISTGTRHAAYSGFGGRALVDPARLLLVRFGTSPKNALVSLSFPVANSTSLIGLELTAQSVSGVPGGVVEDFGVPSPAVIGP